MAWPTNTSDEVVSGQGAKTAGQVIFNRQEETSKRSMTYVFPNKDVTTTLQAVVTKKVMMPPWALSGKTATLRYRFKVSGSATGDITTRLVVGSDTGTSGTETPTTAWQLGDVAVEITSDLAGTMVDVALHVQRTTAGEDTDTSRDIDALNLAMNFEIV